MCHSARQPSSEIAWMVQRSVAPLASPLVAVFATMVVVAMVLLT
jgi:hypothetical protein